MPSPRTKFGTLLKALPDALVGVDQAGVIALVNHRTEALFGYERQDLIGASIQTLLPESVRQVHAAHPAVFAAARDVTNQVQAQKEATRQQTRELNRLGELERLQRLSVGREIKMIEPKKELEYLRRSLPADRTDGGEPR